MIMAHLILSDILQYLVCAHDSHTESSYAWTVAQHKPGVSCGVAVQKLCMWLKCTDRGD